MTFSVESHDVTVAMVTSVECRCVVTWCRERAERLERERREEDERREAEQRRLDEEK